MPHNRMSHDAQHDKTKEMNESDAMEIDDPMSSKKNESDALEIDNSKSGEEKKDDKTTKKKAPTMIADDAKRERLIEYYKAGFSSAKAARIIHIGVRQAQRIVAEYQASGEELVPRRGISSRPNQDREEQKVFTEIFDSYADCSESELKAVINERFGYDVPNNECKAARNRTRVLFMDVDVQNFADDSTPCNIEVDKSGSDYTRNCLFIGDYTWQVIKRNNWFKAKRETQYKIHIDSAVTSDCQMKIELRRSIVAGDGTPAQAVARQRLEFVRKVLNWVTRANIKYVVLFDDMLTSSIHNLIKKEKLTAIPLRRNRSDSFPLNEIMAELKLKIKRTPLKDTDPLDDRFKEAVCSFSEEEISDLIVFGL